MRATWRTSISIGMMPAALVMWAGCSLSGDFDANNYGGGSLPSFYGADASFGVATATPGNPPSFGSTTTQNRPPPAISGGTLLVLKDGTTAVASDPDRDSVYVVNLSTATLSQTIALSPGDEPGRLVQDRAGLVHVVLRAGGAVADIDPAQGAYLGQRHVCPAPRGVAYDATNDRLIVACVGGELVTLGAAPKSPTVSLARVQGGDLRDVVLMGSQMFVSRFRTAELLQVSTDGTGTIVAATPANPGVAFDGGQMIPTTAWRTVPIGITGMAMVHHLARVDPVPPTPGDVGYYNQGDPTCGTSIVESTLTLFDAQGVAQAPSPLLAQTVLPVDLAVSGDLSKLAVISAGNGHTASLPSVIVLGMQEFAASQNSCEPSTGASGPGGQGSNGQPIAVAFDGVGRAVVQTREPATLYFYGSVAPPVVLSTVSREDTGHAIFHSNASGYLACASCHAEGGEDGHVWTFAEGARRTQSLRGTIEGTAPYHWGGDLTDISALVQQVYITRMSGSPLAADQTQALQSWLFSRPAPAVSAQDAASVARGQALFQGSSGCTACHVGPKLTNNATVDVGTGGAFQVPSLVGVSWRAPYLHTGCAQTLFDRFDPTVTDPATGMPCAGTAHGNTTQLTSPQIADLVAYLQTL
jgi:mono/diheme cytochrome c family protein